MQARSSLPDTAYIMTIGVFDGVHRGHQALIARAVSLARERDLRSLAVTFDPPPAAVLRHVPRQQLMTLEDRVATMLELGLDEVQVVEFTPQTAAMTAAEFIDVLSADRLILCTVVGEDFRLGRGREAGVAELEALGGERGFVVSSPPILIESGERISSSRIRSLLRDEGRVDLAAVLLGRPHYVKGEVVRGAGRGAELGVPTANVASPPEILLPLDGVYVGCASLSGRHTPVRAAISVGTNPTFSGRQRTVEAHLLDWQGNLYGETLKVTFARRLREQRTYASVDALVQQMQLDLQVARRRDLNPNH